MPSFPTDIKPQRTTHFVYPSALISLGQSGVVNRRDSTAVGRTWTEQYLLDCSTANARKLMSVVRQYHREGTGFTIQHQSYLTNKGSYGGTPLVAGASQTGSTLNLDGATASVTGWAKAGDIVSVAGINHIFEVAADTNSDGAGAVALPVSPMIYSGGSPADNAAVTVSSVTVNAIVAGYTMPDTDAAEYGVMRVDFRETP